MVEKFFDWWRSCSDIVKERAFVAPDDSSICNQQVKDEIANGNFTLFPFVQAYLHLVKDKEVIILPKSKRIISLKGITIDNILTERNRFFNECAKNIIEFFQTLDEED